MADPGIEDERSERERAFYDGGRSKVLVNIRRIQDQTDLDRFETTAVLNRIGEGLPPEANFKSYAGFKAIHRHLFQDVYDWAGQERRYTTSRDDYKPFAKPRDIAGLMEDRFAVLESQGFLKGSGAAGFAHGSAAAINAFNEAHPFLEGNGRTMRTWLRQIADANGFDVALEASDARAWNDASKECRKRRTIIPMRELIASRLRPSRGMGLSTAQLRHARVLAGMASIAPGRQAGRVSLDWGRDGADQERAFTELASRDPDAVRDVAIEVWAQRNPAAYGRWEANGRQAPQAQGPAPQSRGDGRAR